MSSTYTHTPLTIHPFNFTNNLLFLSLHLLVQLSKPIQLLVKTATFIPSGSLLNTTINESKSRKDVTLFRYRHVLMYIESM